MNFIDLLEVVVRETKTDHSKFVPPKDLSASLAEGDTGLDSLDMTLALIVLGEVYQVPMKTLDHAGSFETALDLKSFLETQGERQPQTLEEAKGYIE